jgi:hypothetical protein
MNRLLPFAALLIACASTPQATRPSSTAGGREVLPPPSSILAVLAHRDGLTLDDGQVATLLEIQRRLDGENADAREKLSTPSERKTPRQGPSGDVQPEQHRSAPAGIRKGSARDSGEPRDREEVFAQAAADNDTRAFLHSEPIFSRGQWERARDIAEKYRIDYAERREAWKRQAPEQAR